MLKKIKDFVAKYGVALFFNTKKNSTEISTNTHKKYNKKNSLYL